MPSRQHTRSASQHRDVPPPPGAKNSESQDKDRPEYDFALGTMMDALTSSARTGREHQQVLDFIRAYREVVEECAEAATHIETLLNHGVISQEEAEAMASHIGSTLTDRLLTDGQR